MCEEIKGTPWDPVPGREGVEAKAKLDMPAAQGPVPQQSPQKETYCEEQIGYSKGRHKEIRAHTRLPMMPCIM